MKERKIELNGLKIIQNDSGLKLTPQLENWHQLSPDATEKLKKWLDEWHYDGNKYNYNAPLTPQPNGVKGNSITCDFTSNKKISYQDKSYLDKRRILRQLSIKDEIRNFVDIMADFICNNLEKNNNISWYNDNISNSLILNLYHYIKTILVDGYLSFEIIYDDKQKDIIGLNQIDPCQLTCENQKDKIQWVVHRDLEPMKRVLTADQIIYMSYPNSDFISYVDELKESYEKMKNIENRLVLTELNLPGNNPVNIDKKITFKELKRSDKRLKFMSKVPNSILDGELNSNDKRFNNFINKISETFKNEFFHKLDKIKNNLRKDA